MEKVRYTILTQMADSSGSVEKGHNAITFINRGTEPAIVNGLSLATNQFLEITANLGEIDDTQWNYTFGTGGGTKLLWIIRKQYGK